MDYDDKTTDKLQAKHYSRVHREKPDETPEMWNNNNSQKPATKSAHRKNYKKWNPNPFAVASLLYNDLSKRLTRNESYLSQNDSQPFDCPSVTEVTNANIETDEQEQNERRPNPFNPAFNRFNRAKEKLIRYQQLQAENAHFWNKVRQDIAEIENENVASTAVISVPDLDTDDDEVYIYPPEEPRIYSISDDDEEEDTSATVDKGPIDKPNDTHDDINVDYDGARLNTIQSDLLSTDLSPIRSLADHLAKPKRRNRHSMKRSHDVAETNFAAVDAYESENAVFPENNASKRMRKQQESGRNHGSHHISSDEELLNAVSEYSKHLAGRRNYQNVGIKEIDWSDDSATEDTHNQNRENGNENWIVTDVVGVTDTISIDLKKFPNCRDGENVHKIETNFDKDDKNVLNKNVGIHPEMGWNREMKAFYNESWGGETHNPSTIRKGMPRDESEWRVDAKDLYCRYSRLQCFNCKETGHLRAFCPQPTKEAICYMCGNTGHRKGDCPIAICLTCGENTSSYRRGCKRCSLMAEARCCKCGRRGHFDRHCPDSWRAYHNTTDPASKPKRVPPNHPKRYCSACAGCGHRAEDCHRFRKLMQDDIIIPFDIRHYDKVYPDDGPSTDNGLTMRYSMFENPRENFQFNWNVNENSDRLYGRFMKATNIRRDAVGGVRAKGRTKVEIPKLNDRGIGDCAPPIVSEKSLSARDTIEQDDVVMREVEPIDGPTVSGVRNGNYDKSMTTDGDQLMQEAIEVDRLRGSMSFSFTKEVDELEDRLNGKTIPRKMLKATKIVQPSDIEVAAIDAISSVTLNAARNSAKIILTKQYAQFLLSTEGNKLLSDAPSTHQVKVFMNWENTDKVLIVFGSTANQDKFHTDLVKMCRKLRIEREMLGKIPRGKVALVKFIRKQFALLEKRLGHVNELYRNMKRNENLQSKDGTKNADRARKHLNIILMGRAGLRDGRMHLAGLENNLKFLLENTNDKMTKQTREEIYEHYRYVFSPFEHDDYPDLIAQYEGMKRAKRFPSLDIDKSLLDIKISAKGDACVDLNRAK